MRTSNGFDTGLSPMITERAHLDTNIPSITQHLPPRVAEVPKEVVKTFAHTKRVGNYLLGKTLGEGSFAKVKEGLHVLTGERVAIKVVDKKRAKEDHYVRKNMRREGKLLQMVQHPNIVRLYEIMETENSYYLVTELCRGGDFMDYICQKKRLDEKEVKKYIRQIISAVDYLHRLGILHRDLKVENLLLDENRDIKLIDFGLSNSIRVSTMRDGQRMQDFCVTQCGSPAYAAPELLGHKQYGPKVDAWSIGVNMYAMLTGSLPFTVEPFNIKILHNKMLNGQMNPIPDHLTKECRDFLRKLLTPDPDKRMSLGEAMKHPWVSEGKNKPMEQNPCPNRIRSDDVNNGILRHMADFCGYRMSDIIRHVTSNIPGPTTAMYHLYKRRLDKYNALQRVRGKIASLGVNNKENNNLSLLLKDPANIVLNKAHTTHSVQQNTEILQANEKHRSIRQGKGTFYREGTLEPKIIQLQIAPGVSLDPPIPGDHRKLPRARPTLKLRKRESKLYIEREKTKDTPSRRVENDVILVDVSNGGPHKQTGEKIKSTETSEHSPEVVTKTTAEVSKGQNRLSAYPQRQAYPTGLAIGQKKGQTLLADLLPKEARLRQRLSRQASRQCGITDPHEDVDNNNNANEQKNIINSAKINICTDVNKPRNDEQKSESKQIQLSSSALQTGHNVSSTDSDAKNSTVVVVPDKATSEQSNLRPLSPSKSSTNAKILSQTPRKSVGIDLREIDAKKLIDIGKSPYCRVHVSKSAGFAKSRSRLTKDLFDPKQVLIEKCGGVVTKSKAKLRQICTSQIAPCPAKQETFQMESIQPISPHSSTDSKSSRSTANHSDQSASTKSSNVALPSISISPTILRNH